MFCGFGHISKLKEQFKLICSETHSTVSGTDDFHTQDLDLNQLRWPKSLDRDLSKELRAWAGWSFQVSSNQELNKYRDSGRTLEKVGAVITMVTFICTQLRDSQGHGAGLLRTLLAARSDRSSVEAGASLSLVTRECSGARWTTSSIQHIQTRAKRLIEPLCCAFLCVI